MMAKGMKCLQSHRLWCYILVAFVLAVFYLLYHQHFNFEFDKPYVAENIRTATKTILVDEVQVKKKPFKPELKDGNELIANMDVKRLMRDLEDDLQECDEDKGDYLAPMKLDGKDEVKPFADVADGKYSPKGCRAVSTVAVIIPHRNSTNMDKILAAQLHRILQAQRLKYGIYVIEAKDDKPMTRGMLLNIGFVESLSEYPYHCVVLHDPELIPEDSRLLFSCHKSRPRYLVSLVRVHGQPKYWKWSTCKRVLSMRADHYRRAGGMPNKYFNPADEDENFAVRMDITRLKPLQEKGPHAAFLSVTHRDYQSSNMGAGQSYADYYDREFAKLYYLVDAGVYEFCGSGQDLLVNLGLISHESQASAFLLSELKAGIRDAQYKVENRGISEGMLTHRVDIICSKAHRVLPDVAKQVCAGVFSVLALGLVVDVIVTKAVRDAVVSTVRSDYRSLYREYVGERTVRDAVCYRLSKYLCGDIPAEFTIGNY